MAFTTFILVLMLLPSGLAELIGYDCSSNNASVTAISLAGTEDCHEINGSVRTTELDAQIIQTRLYQPIHVFSCLVSVTIRVDKCGKLNHLFGTSKPIQSYVKPLGKTGCEEAHREGVVRVFGKSVNNVSSNRTTQVTMFLSGHADDFGYCSNGDVLILDDGTQVESKVVSASLSVTLHDRPETMQIEGSRVIIESMGLNCAYHDSYCEDSLEGEAYWRLTGDDCFSKTEVLYEGQVEIATLEETSGAQTKLAVIESGHRVFALRLEGHGMVCGHSVMETEHARIKIAEKTKAGMYPFPKQMRYHKNVDLTYYVDSKFLYVTSSLVRRSDEIYKQFMNSMCEMRRAVLENRMVLAQIRSHQVGGLIERKKGVMASIQGEIMYITKCSPVPVTFRKATGCYQEFPVWHAEEEKFLEPITHILKSSGTTTTCPVHMTPAFLIGSQWYSYYGNLHLVNDPQKLDPNQNAQDWAFKSLLEISKGGLYDKTDMAELQKTMTFGSTREAIASNFVRVIYDNGKTGSGGISDALTVGSINELGHEFGGAFWSVTSYLGAWSSLLFTVFILLKGLAFLIDVCLNGTALFSKLGWSIWLLAAPLNAVVHLVMHGVVGVPKHKNQKPDRRNRTRQNAANMTAQYDDSDDSGGRHVSVVKMSSMSEYQADAPDLSEEHGPQAKSSLLSGLYGEGFKMIEDEEKKRIDDEMGEKRNRMMIQGEQHRVMQRMERV